MRSVGKEENLNHLANATRRLQCAADRDSRVFGDDTTLRIDFKQSVDGDGAAGFGYRAAEDATVTRSPAAAAKVVKPRTRAPAAGAVPNPVMAREIAVAATATTEWVITVKAAAAMTFPSLEFQGLVRYFYLPPTAL
jgi:hypothetical protein